MFYTLLLHVLSFLAFYVGVGISGTIEFPGTKFRIENQETVSRVLSFAANISGLIFWDGWLLTLIASWVNQIEEKEEKMKMVAPNTIQPSALWND